MLPTASGQMLVQIPQPVASPGTRLVMAAAAAPEMAAQAGQGKYVVMQQPASYKIGKIRHFFSVLDASFQEAGRFLLGVIFNVGVFYCCCSVFLKFYVKTWAPHSA